MDGGVECVGKPTRTHCIAHSLRPDQGSIGHACGCKHGAIGLGEPI